MPQLDQRGSPRDVGIAIVIGIAVVTIASPAFAQHGADGDRTDRRTDLLGSGRASPDAEGETEGERAPETSPASAPEVLFHWDARWGRSGIPNYILIGAGALFAGGVLAVGSQGTASPTRGGWLFDEEARGEMRLDAESDRLLARDISDVLLTTMTSMPLILDAFVLAAWQHDSPDVAFELVLIHAEVAAFTAALQIGANVIVTRERPYGRTCGGGGPDDLPQDSYMCNSAERNYSFFSGHTSQAFAGAAVVCSAHMNLPLLGGGDIEIAPCIAGMGMAAATGVLRILGDQHYVTDVVVGAAIGTTVGFLLPWALHYRHRAPATPTLELEEAELEGVEPIASDPPTMVTLLPTGNGVALYGIF